MTLNTKIGVFRDFLFNFGLWDTFQERTERKLKIDQDNLHMKFSALTVDFKVQVATPYVQGGLHMKASKKGTFFKCMLSVARTAAAAQDR